jgi:hypothetical protein
MIPHLTQQLFFTHSDAELSGESLEFLKPRYAFSS